MPPKSKVVVKGHKKRAAVVEPVEATATTSTSNNDASVAPPPAAVAVPPPRLSTLSSGSPESALEQDIEPSRMDPIDQVIEDEENGIEVDADEEDEEVARPKKTQNKGKGKAIQGGEMKAMQSVSQMESLFNKELQPMAAQDFKGKGLTDPIATVSVSLAVCQSQNLANIQFGCSRINGISYLLFWR
jgi:hypothetical protein